MKKEKRLQVKDHKGDREKLVPREGRVKKFFLGCLGFILAVMGFLGLAVFFLFRSARRPVDLGVVSSSADFVTFINNSGLELGSEPGRLCFLCPVKYEGKKAADFNLSNQQASAWFDAVNDELLSGTQIKIEPDRVSVSTRITYQGVSYPVFASGKIQKAGFRAVKISLVKAKLGKISLPRNLTLQVEEALGQFTNQKLAEINNFEIESLDFRDGYLHFKGTLPEKVTALE